MMIDRYATVGPMPCIRCRRPVIWERVAGAWAVTEIYGDTIRKHGCRARCLTAMRNGACERLTGHVGPHGSRATLDRQAAYMRRYYAERVA